MKRIGILTSGGDCAGLNAVIRAVTLRATQKYKCQVIGIRQGTMGLLRNEPEYIELHPDSSLFNNGLLRLGGTVLGTTNKGDPFNFPMPDGSFKDRTDELIDNYNKLELDALIGIGGDGSLKILRDLAQKGKFNLVAIPKTIDNDLGCTENSIGYMTSVEVATEALDRLQPTAASHDRVMILEVMGRDAGHIALSAGIAGGADVVLIPEIKYDLKNIINKINTLKSRGRNFAMIVVAESVLDQQGKPVMVQDHLTGRSRYQGIGDYLSNCLSQETDAETRVISLGHVQRGGQPIATDRILASSFGVAAVDLIAEKKFDRMVAWQNREIIDVPIAEAIKTYQDVDPNGILVKTARGLDICLGDS